MTNQEILRCIDHTLLSPAATWNDIQQLCEEAIRYSTATVCVPSCYVGPIREHYADRLRICTVVGFPLGYATTEAKLAEAQAAVQHGADEIDMVINITDLKNGGEDSVTEEISLLKYAVGSCILKVIVEACYLTQEEKITACHCVKNGGADFIKTSTGFGPGGATLEDIALFREYVGPNVQIKAAGGIRSQEQIVAFLDAGCSRIGASSALQALGLHG